MRADAVADAFRHWITAAQATGRCACATLIGARRIRTSRWQACLLAKLFVEGSNPLSTVSPTIRALLQALAAFLSVTYGSALGADVPSPGGPQDATTVYRTASRCVVTVEVSSNGKTAQGSPSAGFFFSSRRCTTSRMLVVARWTRSAGGKRSFSLPSANVVEVSSSFCWPVASRVVKARDAHDDAQAELEGFMQTMAEAPDFGRMISMFEEMSKSESSEAVQAWCQVARDTLRAIVVIKDTPAFKLPYGERTVGGMLAEAMTTHLKLLPALRGGGSLPGNRSGVGLRPRSPRATSCA